MVLKNLFKPTVMFGVSVVVVSTIISVVALQLNPRITRGIGGPPTDAEKTAYHEGWCAMDVVAAVSYKGSGGVAHSGDINGDGIVDMTDVELARSYILGGTTLNAGQIAAGDAAENNGVVDGGDVVAIRNKIDTTLTFVPRDAYQVFSRGYSTNASIGGGQQNVCDKPLLEGTSRTSGDDINTRRAVTGNVTVTNWFVEGEINYR